MLALDQQRNLIQELNNPQHAMTEWSQLETCKLRDTE